MNDYALTHLFGEEYCRLFSRTKGIPHIILRPSNGYGVPLSAPFRQWRLLIADVCRSAFSTGRIVLHANPSQERDFVWLGDVARVAEALMSRMDLAGRIFNISSGQSVTLGDVARLAARTAAKVLNRPVELELRAAGYEGVSTFTPHGTQSGDALPQGVEQDMDQGIDEGMGQNTVQNAGCLFVDNTAIKKALGLEFASPMEQEMIAILEFLNTHEHP